MPVLAVSGGRLGVLGDLLGCGDFGGSGDFAGNNGDLISAGFRGVGGPAGDFLRCDVFVLAGVVGASGGLPAETDRSFVDTDNRCLTVAGRRRLAAIRGSDDCRLSGVDDGLDARVCPFSGVLKP